MKPIPIPIQKDGKLTFDSATHCLDWLEAGLWKRMGYVEAFTDAERRKKLGQRQTLCGGCQRWKWPDEQCNFFTPRAEQAERKPRSGREQQ